MRTYPYSIETQEIIFKSIANDVICVTSVLFCVVRAMEVKGAETNQNSVKTFGNKPYYRNSAAPPFYDEVICTQHFVINGRHHDRESVQQQPIGTKSLTDSSIYGRE